MNDSKQDSAALKHIQELAAEEHRLFEQPSRNGDEDKRLAQLQVELDQCWDLLRQRRALREFGGNPSDATLRPPGTVEKYIG